MKLLLTGAPRSGKSSLIRRLAEASTGAAGIITVERRGADHRRIGFDLLAVYCRPGRPLQVIQEAPLARLAHPSGLRVGRYGVEPGALELAVHALDAAMHEGSLVLIDEIGPLQICSPAFREAVDRCLDSRCSLLGSLSTQEDPYLAAIRRRPGVRVLEVTPQNRAHLAEGLTGWLRQG
ncbi:MAG: nucleoside-triphosphatase [Bacillota bacterium]